jgi:DNA (cytosine-5)-methyltransferase 1
MKHLDLFSGIGGFALSATWVWGDEYENIGHSEIEKYACQVYHSHFESPCLGDITKIDWNGFRDRVDLVTGGFPCQPHSVAGHQKGSKDERDLWSECLRCLCGVRPKFALFENVPALFNSDNGRYFNRILSDLAKNGFDAEWQVIPAYSVGANHKRERIWIIAYPNSFRFPQQTEHSTKQHLDFPGKNHWQGSCEEWIVKTDRQIKSQYNFESALCRVDDGLSKQVDRLKGLGNSIVPQVAAVIMQRIKGEI